MKLKKSLIDLKRIFSNDKDLTYRFINLYKFQFMLLFKMFDHYKLVQSYQIIELIKMIEVYGLRILQKDIFHNLTNRMEMLIVNLYNHLTKDEIRENWIDLYQIDILLLRHRIFPLVKFIYDDYQHHKHIRYSYIQLLTSDSHKLDSVIATNTSASIVKQFSKRQVEEKFDDDNDNPLMAMISKNEMSIEFLENYEFFKYSEIYKELPYNRMMEIITTETAKIKLKTSQLLIRYINTIESSLKVFFELSDFLERLDDQETIIMLINFQQLVNQLQKFKEFRDKSYNLLILQSRVSKLIKIYKLVLNNNSNESKSCKFNNILIDSLCLISLAYCVYS